MGVLIIAICLLFLATAEAEDLCGGIPVVMGRLPKQAKGESVPLVESEEKNRKELCEEECEARADCRYFRVKKKRSVQNSADCVLYSESFEIQMATRLANYNLFRFVRCKVASCVLREAIKCEKDENGNPKTDEDGNQKCEPQGVTGTIDFKQMKDGETSVTGTVKGLAEGEHGFHVHKFGNILKGDCTSAGGHYNPYGLTHGAPTDKVRHAGDLGNILAVADQDTDVNIKDAQIPLTGENSIIGRAIVVHYTADDLGKGGNTGSLAHGNAGPRMACGVIGHADNIPKGLPKVNIQA